MTVLEVACFDASEALLGDHELTRASLEALAKSDGCIKVYYGFDVDKGKKAFMAAIWESFDHYKKFTKSDGYPAVVESMKPAMAGPLQMQHVEVKTDPTTALEAPVTEITIVSLKEGRTFEEVRAMGEKVDANAHLAKGAHIPSSWGPTFQDGQKIVVAAGWDSVEDHAALPGTPPFTQIFVDMAELADLTINHVKFMKLVVQ